MPAPFGPNDFREALISPSGDFCGGVLKKLLRRLPELVYGFVNYIFDESGNLSQDFQNDICSLTCKGGTGITETVPDGTLAKPTSVSATDGTVPNKVVITWIGSAGASGYFVFRSTSSLASSIGAPIGLTSSLTLDDTLATPGVIYYYFVRAISSGNSSPLSDSDTGFVEDDNAPGGHIVDFFSPTTLWKVPDTISAITGLCIGGGGGGGGGQRGGPNAATKAGAGGGGGGGGGKCSVGAISVSAGEYLSIVVGAGGIFQNNNGTIGGNGGDSKILRAATALVTANGGFGGHGATFTGGNPTLIPTPGAGGSGGGGCTTIGNSGFDGTAGTFDAGSFGQGGFGASSLFATYGHGGNGQTMAGTTSKSSTPGSPGFVRILY